MELYVLIVVFILMVFNQQLAFGIITNIDVPNYIKQGQTATFGCTFNDNKADLLFVNWYRSADNITDTSEAYLMHMYNVIEDRWTDNTEGKTTASVDTDKKMSFLTIETVDCKEDDLKYWCYVRIFIDAFEKSASTDVCNCPTLTLKIKKKGEPIPDVARNNSIELLSGDSVVFESKAGGYKPDTQNLITWTLGETEKSASLGSPGPSGNDMCPDLLDVSSELSYSAKVDDNKKMLCATAALPSCNCSEQFCVQLLITDPDGPQPKSTMIAIGVGCGCACIIILAIVILLVVRCRHSKPTPSPEPTPPNSETTPPKAEPTPTNPVPTPPNSEPTPPKAEPTQTNPEPTPPKPEPKNVTDDPSRRLLADVK